jgi:2-polyprenyl-3-methyl-5-hydroxy-6-metoxy-1,4-benzoquinol methylase
VSATSSSQPLDAFPILPRQPATPKFPTIQRQTTQFQAVELETVNCLLCGGREHETLIVARDHLTGLGGDFRVVRCRHCQLAFTNPRPNAASLGLFYPANYAPHAERQTDGGWRERWLRMLEVAHLRRRFGYPPQTNAASTVMASWLARAVIRRRRAREQWIPYRAPGRLLDFGCGAGQFSKRMRDYGWNVEGLDVSPQVVQMLRETCGLRTHLGSLPHPDIPEGSFAAITMWHSLEHVPFPQEVLRAAWHALQPGGLLAVGVPNFASWSFRQFREHWTGLGLPRHLTHFTPTTLRHMVEAAGFRVLALEQVGRDGWIRKSARRRIKVQRGAGTGWLRALQWKGLAHLAAQWTELTDQADTLRLIAEKIAAPTQLELAARD